MNNLVVNQTPRTSTFGVVILATQLATISPAFATGCSDAPRVAKSFDEQRTYSSVDYSQSLDSTSRPMLPLFEDVVSEFYADLLHNQKGFELAFQQALYDNVWDLLES